MKISDMKSKILSIDDANTICCDCGEHTVTHASINNGITLCELCAEIHTEFGPSVSYIKSLDDEEWDDYLLAYMIMGSNSKFKRGLEALGVDMNLSISDKYNCNGCFYYRKCLKSKVKGSRQKEIDYENPNEIPNNPSDIFPEFKDYKLNQITIFNKNKSNQENKTQGKLKKSNSIIYNVKKTLTNVGKNIEGAVENLNIKDKIITGGQATVSGLKKAGVLFVKKSDPAAKKIKSGYNYIGGQVKNAVKELKEKIKIGNKDKINKGKIEDNSKNNNNENKQGNNDNDINNENIDNCIENAEYNEIKDNKNNNINEYNKDLNDIFNPINNVNHNSQQNDPNELFSQTPVFAQNINKDDKNDMASNYDLLNFDD